jgi:hypothetical protein
MKEKINFAQHKQVHTKAISQPQILIRKIHFFSPEILFSSVPTRTVLGAASASFTF